MDHTDPPQFPVVALGGSAGGLEAFFAFFEVLEDAEDRGGMAFVVVLHVAPDEESQLADLLAQRTALPVRSVDTRMRVEAGHVYVLPPGRTLHVADGDLIPTARADGAAHRPVDDIFDGLARAFGERAVAVVCSGMGSNGSSALGAIREAAGCTFVQTPETAQFDVMPRNAIATGLVDLVAPVAEMIPALARNHRRLRDRAASRRETTADPAATGSPPADDGQSDASEATLTRILHALRERNGIDFRHYKSSTLHRRIDRRASLQDTGAWEGYAELLERCPQEVDTLTGDLLINVTDFFRDADSWDVLRDKVLAPMIRSRAEDEPVRIWSAGCATGEEVYSAAISTLDLIRARGARVQAEIFATDASPDALSRARAGRYPQAAVDGLPRNVRERWFEDREDTVQTRSELREQVVFAQHNLIQDPPFSHVDLVICRNLLIYLRPEMQQKLIRLFHFALREGGYLFLGASESVGQATDLFEPVDKGAHIWRCIGPTRHDLVEFPLTRGRRAHPPEPAVAQAHSSPAKSAPKRLAQDALTALAERHAPPALVVDADLDVVYFHGATEPFLKARSGAPTQNLFGLVRDFLVPHLRRLIDTVKASGGPEHTRIGADPDAGTSVLRVDVAPMPGPDGRLLVALVAEQDEHPSPEGGADPAPGREREMEETIRGLRSDLAATAWTAERNDEDSRAYNEEITSMNEELRAANEELETSKEELQSLNEELRTVNTQLHTTVGELRERTADLDNLLSSTGVATLFLDADLSVRWFSPALQDLFHVREPDVGRPVGHVVRTFRDDALEDECRAVLRDLDRRERRVKSEQGRSFQRQITPYRTTDDRIAGVVVTFNDVTEIHEARRYAEHIVETVPMPLVILDTELRVVSANGAFYTKFEADKSETAGRLIYQLGNGQWNLPDLRHLLEEVLPDNRVFQDYEVTHEFETIGRKTMHLNGRRLEQDQLILLAIEDVTEQKAAEAHQELLMGELSHRVKNALGVVQGLAAMTIRRSNSLEEFREAFTGRLSAYAQSHGQLLGRDWRPGTLEDLVKRAINGHAVDPERFIVEGPSVELSANEALAMGLILHELETNAVKYGALSTETGRVSIAWSLHEDVLRLSWSEHYGPEVTTPEKEGFGSVLIRQFVSHDLGGAAEISYEPGGLICAISFPKTASAGN